MKKRKLLAVLTIPCVFMAGCSTEPVESEVVDTEQTTEIVVEVDASVVTEKSEETEAFIEETVSYNLTDAKVCSVDDLRLDGSIINLSDIHTHKEPKRLLVVLFNYNNGALEGEAEELEKIWGDYIFGSEDSDEQSVNDYFLEVSNGQFWYEPVLLGDNTTGVYSFRLDKDYSDQQAIHSEYAFFDFSYDAAFKLSELEEIGLDTDSFAAEGIDANNYYEEIIDFFDSNQSQRPAEWFDTDSIMFIFPTYNTERVDLTPVTSSFDKYGLYTHINFDSSYGTFAHELCHTLGAVDIYNYGLYFNDLMSMGYDQMDTFDTAHIDPYYKFLWGWNDAMLCESDGSYALYPQDSENYAPLLIPTDDPNQYFLIENRNGTGFDSYIKSAPTSENYLGINVWRVDKLALDKIYTDGRCGISFEGALNNAGEAMELFYYDDIEDVYKTSVASTGISIEFESMTDDYIVLNVRSK